jgi:hypothetical protein
MSTEYDNMTEVGSYKKQILEYLNQLDQYPIDLIKEHFLFFDMFIQPDPKAKPGYVPTELSIIKVNGNGLCWINSLLVSIFGRFWQDLEQLDMWIKSICHTLKLNDNFVSILKIELYLVKVDQSTLMNFDLHLNPTKSDEYDFIGFLNDHKYLMFVLSVNILKFAIQFYTEPQFNLTNNLLPLETGIAFNPNEMKIYAIDGQLRNFIMSIMGFQKVVVWQHNTKCKNRRHTHVNSNLTAIDYYGEYAGFEIQTQHIINTMGSIGTALLFTYNSEHYDAFFNNDTFKTTMASELYDEELPKFVYV